MGEIFTTGTAADFFSDANNIVASSTEMTQNVMTRSKLNYFIARKIQERNAIITIGEPNTNQAGTHVPRKMIDVLRGTGAIGNVELNTSQETLKKLTQMVVIDTYAHTVVDDTPTTTKAAADTFKADSKYALEDWNTRMADNVKIAILSDKCTNIVCAGHHDTQDTSNIEKSDIATLDDIDELRRRADGYGIGETRKPKIKPFRTNRTKESTFLGEKPTHILWATSTTVQNLRKDPNWKKAQENAAEKGKDNILFRGGAGEWNGVLIVEMGEASEDDHGMFRSDSFEITFGGVTFDPSQYAGKIVNGKAQQTDINLLVGVNAGHIIPVTAIRYWEDASPQDSRRMQTHSDTIYGFVKTQYNAKSNGGVLKDSVLDGNDIAVIAFIASSGN